MEPIENNKWKIVFLLIISVIAFAGYRYSHVTISNPVVAAVDNSNNMATVSRDDIYPIIKDYIMNHPEVILESLTEMQKKKSEEEANQLKQTIQSNKAAFEDSSNAAIVGGNNAGVTIVMFYDYNCGHCKEANASLNELLDTDKDVKVVYRPMGLLSESSDYLANVMSAVYKISPDKFKTLHDLLMASSQISKEDVANILAQNSISSSVIEAEIAKDEVKNLRDNNNKLAHLLKLNGVPLFLINGTAINGGMDLDSLKKIVNDARAGKQ